MRNTLACLFESVGLRERERERGKRGKFFRILNVQPAPSRIRSEFLTFTHESQVFEYLSLVEKVEVSEWSGN